MAASKDYRTIENTEIQMQRSSIGRSGFSSARGSFEVLAPEVNHASHTKATDFAEFFAKWENKLTEKLGLTEKRRVVSLLRMRLNLRPS